MTGNLIATSGISTGPPGFQRAYWSINFVDFSVLQWQSASVNWMGAEGLQWPYLMKRSCMSGDNINKAKGHPSSSLRSWCTVSWKRPPSGRYFTAVKSGQMSAYVPLALDVLDAQQGGRGERTKALRGCNLYALQLLFLYLQCLHFLGSCFKTCIFILHNNKVSLVWGCRGFYEFLLHSILWLQYARFCGCPRLYI